MTTEAYTVITGSEMTRRESVERMAQGLLYAADRMRELGKQTNNPVWNLAATNIDNLRRKAEAVVFAKDRTRNQILASVDDFQNKRAAASDLDTKATNETSLAIN